MGRKSRDQMLSKLITSLWQCNKLESLLFITHAKLLPHSIMGRWVTTPNLNGSLVNPLYPMGWLGFLALIGISVNHSYFIVASPGLIHSIRIHSSFRGPSIHASEPFFLTRNLKLPECYCMHHRLVFTAGAFNLSQLAHWCRLSATVAARRLMKNTDRDQEDSLDVDHSLPIILVLPFV